MGETTLEALAATVKHQGETLTRLEGKIDNVDKNQRTDFRWILGGIGAFALAVIAAPYVLPPASAIPQHSPGGYTLTVHPYPALNSPVVGASPASTE